MTTQKLKELIIEYTGNRKIAAMDASSYHSPEQFLKWAAREEPKMRWAYNNPTKSEYLYGELVPTPLADGRPGQIAYIYLPQFPYEDPNGDEARLFQLNAYTVLNELYEAKPDEWVFDFRGHSGGLIGVFMGFISLFMPDHYVVLTKDIKPKSDGTSSSSSSGARGLSDERGSRVRFVFSAGHFRMFSRRKMVLDSEIEHYGAFRDIGPTHILVDDVTGSCGEFMALLLRLNLKKATIYGTKTIGAMTIPDVIVVDGYVLSVPTAVLHVDGTPRTTIEPDETTIPSHIQAIIPR